VQDVVTIHGTNAAFAAITGTEYTYRLYQNSSTTISTKVGKITKIEFIGSNNSLSNYSLKKLKEEPAVSAVQINKLQIMENLIQPARPSISDATDVICEKCQNPYFIEVLVVKKISKILTGAEKDQIFQLPKKN
jgi:hypothetical protein